MALKKDEDFQKRVKYLNKYLKYLLLNTIGMTLFIGWAFYYAGLTLVSLLVYPVINFEVTLLGNIKYNRN